MMKESISQKKEKRLVLVVSTALFFFFALSAPFTINSISAQKPEWKWPASLSIGTPGIGSTTQLQTASWTPVLEKMTGMKVRVMPENSAPLRLRWLKTGLTDVETESSGSFVGQGMEAREGYAVRGGGPFQARLLWLAQIGPLAFMIRGDSDIKTIYDLKSGKRRFAICTGIPGAELNIYCLLAWLELRKEDVILVPFGSWKDNILSVAEGKADVTVVTTPAAATYEAAARGVRFLPLPYKEDPKGAERFLNVRPTLMFGPVKEGVKEALGIPSFYMPYLYYVRLDMSQEFAYQLAKWLTENHGAYEDKYVMCKHMNIDIYRGVLDSSYLPVHEGVIKYLKEKKMWTSADDVRQEKNIKLLTMYENAYEAAIADADKKKIKIDPANKEWVELWNSFKKDLPHFRAF